MGAAAIRWLLPVPVRRAGVRTAAAAVAAMLVASCGTAEPGRRAAEYLDDATGATITRVEQPFVLFSDDQARAANAHDYISAAPLAVNQSGRRSWWLWLGLWSTIDRGVSVGDARLADVAAIQLIVDGEPMELDLGARLDRIPGVTSMPYAAPVATARTLVLPLTGSQVTRLSRGTSILIRTELAGEAALLWQPWIGSGSWTGFAELAAADPGAAP
jgi:hypothetical protein